MQQLHLNIIWNSIFDLRSGWTGLVAGVPTIRKSRILKKTLVSCTMTTDCSSCGVLTVGPHTDYLEQKIVEKRFKLYRLCEAEDPNVFLQQNGASIRGVVCSSLGPAGPEILGNLPNLEIISTVSVGLDHIDLEWCKKRNVKVAYTPDVVTDDVADLAIALMISTLRQLHAADRFVRQGHWTKNQNFKLTSRLSRKTIGILGLGRIGLGIARRGEAFGCKIAYYSRTEKPNSYIYHSSVHDLARNCDVLVVACPLSAETRHIVDRSVLDALGPNSILVNIGRGALVDEKELVNALVEGRLGGAGLDVYENEPVVPKELLDMDNVVLLPHVGTATWETRKEMADLVIANLEAHFSQKPLLTPAF